MSKSFDLSDNISKLLLYSLAHAQQSVCIVSILLAWNNLRYELDGLNSVGNRTAPLFLRGLVIIQWKK